MNLQLIASKEGRDLVGVLVIMDQNIQDHQAFEGRWGWGCRGESVLTSCQVLVLICTSIDQLDKGKHEILKCIYISQISEGT
jgi:hypothetical protein